MTRRRVTALTAPEWRPHDAPASTGFPWHRRPGRAVRGEDLVELVRDRLPSVAVQLSHVSVETPRVATFSPIFDGNRRSRRWWFRCCSASDITPRSTWCRRSPSSPDRSAPGHSGPDPVLSEVLRQRLLEAGATDGDVVVMAVTGSSDPSATVAAGQACALLDWPGAVFGHLAAGQPTVAEVVAGLRAALPAAPCSGRVLPALPRLLPRQARPHGRGRRVRAAGRPSRDRRPCGRALPRRPLTRLGPAGKLSRPV